jgi:hypothetical protein
MKLSQEEIGFLRQLEDGPQTISGNRSNHGLKGLVNLGLVLDRSLSMAVTEYKITAAGRAALAKLESGDTNPAIGSVAKESKTAAELEAMLRARTTAWPIKHILKVIPDPQLGWTVKVIASPSSTPAYPQEIDSIERELRALFELKP